MKVLLIALESISNIGEELLRASTEFLVRESCEKAKISIAQLKPNKNIIPKEFKIDYYFGAALWKCFSWMKNNSSYRLKKICYIIKYYRYESGEGGRL